MEMKKRNPNFGYLRIAIQMKNMFNIDVDKDVVRRVLQKHQKHYPSNNGGPSWLALLANMKDSLWSIDLFRCESISLKSHWVMVVMDQFTRRIVGFSTHAGGLNGIAVCCMFNKIISKQSPPSLLSSDNDPLFQYHRWKENQRILDINEIKTLPYIPMSHPFVERLIRSIRHELLDQTFFWNANDLQRKLDQYQQYFNSNRSHQSLFAITL
jgi:putative transposase